MLEIYYVIVQYSDVWLMSIIRIYILETNK